MRSNLLMFVPVSPVRWKTPESETFGFYWIELDTAGHGFEIWHMPHEGRARLLGATENFNRAVARAQEHRLIAERKAVAQ